MEALKRHRAGAQQNITLQNVSVSEGGQAIVGNVTQPPLAEKAAAPPAAAFAGTNIVQMPINDEGEDRALAAGRRKSIK